MLVVGASASGVQIADELQRRAGVVLAVGSHTRLPRSTAGWTSCGGWTRSGCSTAHRRRPRPAGARPSRRCSWSGARPGRPRPPGAGRSRGPPRRAAVPDGRYPAGVRRRPAGHPAAADDRLRRLLARIDAYALRRGLTGELDPAARGRVRAAGRTGWTCAAPGSARSSGRPATAALPVAARPGARRRRRDPAHAPASPLPRAVRARAAAADPAQLHLHRRRAARRRAVAARVLADPAPPTRRERWHERPLGRRRRRRPGGRRVDRDAAGPGRAAGAVPRPVPRGSDTVSTHALMRGGVLQLHRWGLLDASWRPGPPRSAAPSSTTAPSRAGDAPPGAGVDALYAPRRTLLDGILVDAARRAGAEVRFGSASPACCAVPAAGSPGC